MSCQFDARSFSVWFGKRFAAILLKTIIKKCSTNGLNSVLDRLWFGLQVLNRLVHRDRRRGHGFTRYTSQHPRPCDDVASFGHGGET